MTTLVCGVLLALLVAASSGGGIGTPFLTASGSSGQVHVGNGTDAEMWVGGWSLTTFQFSAARAEPQGKDTMFIGGEGSSQPVLLVGFTRSWWPLHLWMGTINGSEN